METSKSRTDETLSTLGLKKVTMIGIWNVRTLRENGEIQQLEEEMNNYKLGILGVIVVRWNQFEEINTARGETFIFSGRGGENEYHKADILVTKSVRRILIE
jgi:hypothetical protein